ncbi:MAG: hypothetical protein QE271_07080 [Bacteriovoracaceae bacterium]|nr:hypothetical protein [Bacteriovoracaceae bacterium]
MDSAKANMRKFVDEFIADFSAEPGSSNQTYQFNTQLFSITKQKQKEEEKEKNYEN